MRIPICLSQRFPAALLALTVILCAVPALCQPAPIKLPKPQTTGGMPLMQALQNRKTTRAFRDQSLPLQTLSNLLWAAFGINRTTMPARGPQSHTTGRTAPSAINLQDIEIDVLLAGGVYIYDAEQNQLRPVADGDQRPHIGTPPARQAAVTLVYVAPVQDNWAQVDIGFIGQNVYLFAASEGLNAWFYTIHGAQETAAAAAALKISADKQPLYAQSVGYPPQ
jgi:hypothetical protein